MKMEYKFIRAALLILSWVFIASVTGQSTYLSAQERQSGSSVVEPKEEQTVKRSERSTAPDEIRHTVRLVGPSAEEIHDFLYPVVEDLKPATPAN